MLYFLQTDCGKSGFIEGPEEAEGVILNTFGSFFGCRECAMVTEWPEGGPPEYRIDPDGSVWERSLIQLKR